jgi:hypothetical protein
MGRGRRILAMREEAKPMVDPVKSGSAPVNIAAQNAAASPQSVVQSKADVSKPDTVEISDAAQARSMRQQGLSIPEIALQLRLDVKTVTEFFPKSS